jgi:hypothetical protein
VSLLLYLDLHARCHPSVVGWPFPPQTAS